MVSKIKLSHTSIETYKTCGYKYHLHYNEQLRDTKIGSALFFGSALDSAVEILLLRKKDNLTDKEQEKLKQDPKDVFVKKLTFVPVNNEIVNTKKSNQVLYYKNDFNHLMINEQEQKKLKKDGFEIDQESAKTFIEECYEIIKNGSKLAEDEQELFNLLHWYSIRKKGLLLLEAYEKQILPKINKVHEIQKAVKLEDEEGNILRGYIDFVADWDNEGKVVFDNKTSSRKYTKDSVKESQQLIIYGEDEDHYKAGFIVMLKNIKHLIIQTCINCDEETTRKVKTCDNKTDGNRCGGELTQRNELNVEIQVIVDDLVHELQEKVFQDIGEVLQNIKQKKFDKDWDSCYSFGRKCQYYDYCRNGSTEGLVKLKEKNEG